jgi:hypothetical protein
MKCHVRHDVVVVVLRGRALLVYVMPIANDNSRNKGVGLCFVLPMSCRHGAARGAAMTLR